MLRIQHTVIVLTLIITLYKINCASIDIDNEIEKAPRGLGLKIREETVIANSSLEEGWIEETIKTPSGASVSIASLVSSENCTLNTTFITLDKNGNISNEEYALVSSEVNKSKKSGCFKILKIRKVKNECLWDRYRNRRENIMIETKSNSANERLLFHGTDYVRQIANKGYDERLARVGPFGEGIYFTDSFAEADSKVIETCILVVRGRCMCLREVLLSRVILGKQYKEIYRRRHAHAPIAHHSVLGTQRSAAHDDYVVYRGDQTYPEYVITYETC